MFAKTKEQNQKVFFNPINQLEFRTFVKSKLILLTNKLGSLGQSSHFWSTEPGQRFRCARTRFSYQQSRSGPSTGTWTWGTGMLSTSLPSYQSRELDQSQSSDQEGNWKFHFSDIHPRPPADNVIKIKRPLMRVVTELIQDWKLNYGVSWNWPGTTNNKTQLIL